MHPDRNILLAEVGDDSEVYDWVFTFMFELISIVYKPLTVVIIEKITPLNIFEQQRLHFREMV